MVSGCNWAGSRTGRFRGCYVILVLSDLGPGVGGQLTGRVTGRADCRWAQGEGRRVAVVDHSKFGVPTGWRICAAADIHILVTDTGAPLSATEPFEQAGVKVMRV